MVMKTKNTELYENKDIHKLYNKTIKELEKFYEIKLGNNPPKLILVDTRKEFDSILNEKTENWVVGTVIDKNKIVLISPDNYEKESCHKFSKEDYDFLLKHELSHTFYNIYTKGAGLTGPVWLDEGLAIYTSGELIQKEEPKKLKLFLEYYNYDATELYGEAGFVIKKLINTFGKEKIFELLKKLNGIKNEDDFRKVFEKIFQIKLNYEEFNKLLY
jgi:hypothetical protein